ncbi:MAG: hypothetical protein LW875_05180 [Proteobacteria bacterium]|nr:hypothetical protein [Pseudomonadota bacterium]
MENFVKKIEKPLVLLSIQILGLYLWFLAGFMKLSKEGALDGFSRRFEGSGLDALPGGVALQFYGIAVFELVIALFFAFSLLQVEFRKSHQPWLRLGLLGALLILVVLGFGLRFVGDHSGFANIYFYIGATLVFFFIVKQYEKENL